MHSEDEIRSPGEWLDEEMSESEMKEIAEFSEITQKIREEAQTTVERLELAAQRTPRLLNTFMHFFYRISQKEHGLKVESGKVVDLNGNEVDLIAMVMDFIDFSMVTKDDRIKRNSLLYDLQNIAFPSEIVQPIDQITQKFFKNEFKPNKSEVVSFTKKGKKGKAAFKISLMDLPPEIKLSRDIEPFDNLVFTAVLSLYEAGNKHFTGQSIYHSLTGDPNAKASTEKLKEIDDSWTRLTSTAIKLNTGTVSELFGKVQWERTRRIIEGGKDTISIQNQTGLHETTIYTMNEQPLLQEYANCINQIRRYPIDYLNTPVNKTTEISILQKHLLDHIAAIPKISDHILYETLFSKIDISAPTANAEKQKKSKLRKQIYRMLDYWKQIGFIYNWSEEKKGKTLHAIVIIKNPPKAIAQKDPGKNSN